MTTSIYDIYNKAVASDTRWSIFPLELSDGGEYILYSDDTGFEKIIQKNGYAIIFSGFGPLISEWKQWLNGGMDFSNTPALSFKTLNKDELVHLIIIDMYENKPVFDDGSRKIALVDESAHNDRCYTNQHGKKFVFTSIGSGSRYAADNWNLTRCHFQAIGHASQNDIFTSEVCRTIDFVTEQQNFSKDCDKYDTIQNSIFRNGMMMKVEQVNTNSAVSIHSHPLGREVKRVLNDGKAYATAPAPELEDFEWTDEARENLDRALKLVAKGREDRSR